MDNLSAFRLGDIRGIYPDDIDESFVEAFAHAFVGHFNLKGSIATGRDMRASSDGLQQVLNDTLASIGINVINMGLCPTELGYFASGQDGIEAAIVVTASHNPADYNGLKCVLKNGRAITFDNDLRDIAALMQGQYRHPARAGAETAADLHELYLNFLRTHFMRASLSGGAIALNGLNGTASTMADMIASDFELPVTWFRREPGPIPENGADPTNPKLAEEMQAFMSGEGFALGVAWDSDCDRCVFFDDDGTLIPTYYVVGLLADDHLRSNPGGTIVFDTKLCWNTMDIVQRHGGRMVFAETGHAFMKQKMHEHRAGYGGELSSHHYFGDFFGCDTGMFAWLSVLQLMNRRGESLKDLIAAQKAGVCCTPEISLALSDVNAAFASILQTYGEKATHVDNFDGLSFSMPGDWRFSLRRSKTEPVVRLNFEARRKPDTLLEEGQKVFEVLTAFRADEANWLERFHIQ